MSGTNVNKSRLVLSLFQIDLISLELFKTNLHTIETIRGSLRKDVIGLELSGTNVD